MRVMNLIRGREPEEIGTRSLHHTISREVLVHLVNHGVYPVTDIRDLEFKIAELIAGHRHDTDKTIAGLIGNLIRREARGI